MAKDTLDLDVSRALAAVRGLDDALGSAAGKFGQSLARALANLNANVTIDPDTGKITPEIDSAVDAADTEPAIDADTGTIPGEITSAVDAADTTATVDLDDSSLDGAKQKADDLGGSLVRVRDIATAIGVAFGAKEVASFFAESVSAASDLAESTNKARVVFRGAAEDVIAFGDSAAQSVGLANTEAIEAASSFGALFTTTGLGNREAAKLSTSMVTLAADLASVNNVPVPEALERLRSGLIGEAEPLRRLNVLLSATAVETKATELGLRDANGELSEGAKVQARYALIMEQTTRFQGDFARTSEDLANAQRILQAEFKQVQVAVGNALLPTVLDLIKAGGDELLPVFEKLAVAVATLGSGAIPVLASGAGSLLPILDTLATVLELVPPELAAGVLQFAAMARILPTISGGMGAAVTAFVALSTVLRAVNPEVADAVTQVGFLAAAGFRVAGPLGAVAGAALGAGTAFDLMAENAGTLVIDIEAVSKASDKMLRTLAQQIAAAESLGIGFDASEQALSSFKTTTEGSIGAGERLGKAFLDAGLITEKQFNRVLGDAVKQEKQLEETSEAGASAVDEQSTAFEEAGDAAKAYSEALDVLAGGQTDQFAAQTGFAESVAGLTEAWKKAKGSIDLGSEAGLKNRDALVSAVGSAQSYAQAIVAAGGTADAANAPIRDLAGQIAFMSTVSGQSPQQIAALLASLGLLTPAAAQGVTDAATLKAAIEGIGPAAGAAADGVTAANVPGAVDTALAQANVNAEVGVARLKDTSSKGGADAGTAIGEGVKATAPPGVEAGTRLADQALGQVARLILNGTALNAGLGAGTLLASGLAQGITQHTDWVEEAARKAVRAAKEAADREARAKSPSRLFAELGQDLSAGLALGISENLGVVKAASANTVAAAAVSARGESAAPVAPTVVVEPSPTIGSLQINGSSDPQATAAAVGRELAFQRRFAGAGR